jgi:hypothetical protein
MNRRLAWVSGLGVGAGLMFLLDPDMGRTRRELLRDRLLSLMRTARWRLGQRARDARNRAVGAGPIPARQPAR